MIRSKLNKLIFILTLLFVLIIDSKSQTVHYSTFDTLDQCFNYQPAIYHNGFHYALLCEGVMKPVYDPLLGQTKYYNSFLLKLDNSLNLINSIIIDSLPGYLFNATDIKIYQDTIIISGRAVKPDASDEQIFVSNYDLDFNKLSTSMIGDTNRIEIIANMIINDKNNIVISGKVYLPPLSGYFLAYECDRKGNVLKSISDTSCNTIGSFAIQIPNSKDYQFVSNSGIYICDSNLVKKEIIHPEYFNRFYSNGEPKHFNEDYYFIVGTSHQFYNKANEDFAEITYYLVDYETNAFDSGFIAKPDTNDWGTVHFYNNPDLVYGGIHNNYVDEFFPFCEATNWVYLQSIDFDTKNINWEFSYGGNAFYDLHGLYITPENECVIYSSKYDFVNTDIKQRDIIIMIVDSTGIITENSLEVDYSGYFSIYPNPGDNKLRISTNNFNGYFELADLNGNIVKSIELNNNQHYIETESLNCGIYIYRIIDNNFDIVRKGKWIKN